MTDPIRFGDLYKESADALKPLPDGEYPATVQDAEATTSQNGKPMIKLKLLITTAAGAKKVIPTQMVVSVENPTALAIFFRQCEAFGIGSSFWSNNATLESAAAVMRGKALRVVLGTSEWQGQPRNDVKNYLAPLGGLQTGPATAPTLLGTGPAPAGPAGPSPLPTPAPQPTIGQPTVAAQPTPPTGESVAF